MNTSRSLDLPDTEVHVWWLDESQVSLEQERAASACLAPQEVERANRFRRAEDRRRVRLTRILARHVLSKYAAATPADWMFGTGPHGKPMVVAPAANLQCNVSRTRGMVVCGVVRRGAIGVDVEQIKPTDDYLDVAAHAFSAAEVAALRALETETGQRSFYKYWTLKEALGKARGDGLGFQTQWSTFAVESRDRVRLATATHEDPAQWWFALTQPRPSHQVAVAHRDADRRVSDIVVRELALDRP